MNHLNVEVSETTLAAPHTSVLKTLVWQRAVFLDNKESKQQHLVSSQEHNCLLSTFESSFILLPLWRGAPVPRDAAFTVNIAGEQARLSEAASLRQETNTLSFSFLRSLFQSCFQDDHETLPWKRV